MKDIEWSLEEENGQPVLSQVDSSNLAIIDTEVYGEPTIWLEDGTTFGGVTQQLSFKVSELISLCDKLDNLRKKKGLDELV